jgi:hypothetical protein
VTTTYEYAKGGGPYPGGELDELIADQFTLSVIETADPQVDNDLSLLVKATLLDPEGGTIVEDGMPFPGGEIDDPVPGEWMIVGSEEEYWLAGNRGITTKPEDVPANLPIPGGLVGKLNYQMTLFRDTDPMQGNQVQASESGFGELRINDADGRVLDHLMPLSWDGGHIEIYRGRHEDLRSSWTRIASMTTQGIFYDALMKRIRLRDAAWRLEQGEIQPLRYLGTGGLEGDASIKGQPKPYGMGYCYRTPLQMLSATKLIGQLSNSSIFLVHEVEDGGIALAYSGNDYATYEALDAATVAAGQYSTCLAFGLIRLGALPTKQITVTFSGDNDTVQGHARPITRANMIRRIVCGLGQYRLNTSTDLDQESFGLLDNSFTDELGYFWNQPISKMTAIREIMSGLSGSACVRFDGKLAVFPAMLPTGSPHLTLRYQRDFKTAPKMMAYSPPRLGTYVGWSRNYTPQTRDQLQTTVPEASALVYSQEMRVEPALTPANSSIWPTSQNVTVNGGFRYQDAANREANRQQVIFRTRRERWGVEVPMDQYSNVLGRQVDVTNWTRYNFTGGRSFRAAAIAINDPLNLMIELWG